jgi:hypothetical protein
VDPDISLPVLEDRSVPEVLAVWAGRNGCDAAPRIEEVADDVQRFSWTGCSGEADVQLYVIEGGGHSWPGSDVSMAAEAMIGPTSRSIRADELISAFFRDHPMRCAVWTGAVLLFGRPMPASELEAVVGVEPTRPAAATRPVPRGAQPTAAEPSKATGSPGLG